MALTISAKEIFLENEILKNGYITVEHDKITEIGQIGKGVTPDITLDEFTLTPAFIDIHTHGGNGHDTMDSSVSAINELSQYKVNEGVGYFCPTTISAPLEKIQEAIGSVGLAMENGTPGAVVLGAFMEGPYIDRNYRGSHNEKYIRDINLEELDNIIKAAKGAIKTVAIAPNIKNAVSATKLLVSNNIIVSIGHSGATSDEAGECIDAGASVVVHTFNAMTPLNHRSSGMTGRVLYDDRVYCEAICDLVHLSKETVGIIYRCKTSDKMISITDSIAAGGLSDGRYVFGDMTINVRDSIPRTEKGALAGSTLRLSQALKNLVETVGLTVFDSVKTMTQSPAKALNLYSEIGSIGVGKKASLTAFDKDFNIQFVMVEGDIKINSAK